MAKLFVTNPLLTKTKQIKDRFGFTSKAVLFGADERT